MRVLLLFIFLPVALLAQDPKLSHPENFTASFNPALIHSETDWFRTAYRNQWPQLSGNYITTYAGYFHRLDNWDANIGLSYSHDQAGRSLTTQNIGLTYAQAFDVGIGSIVGGIELGYGQKNIDWSKVTFGDMIDPRRGFVYNTNDISASTPANYFNASAGLMFEIENYLKIGYAAHHINRPNESLVGGNSPLPIRHTVHFKYHWDVGARWSVDPYFNAHFQDQFNCFQTGLIGNFNRIVSGGIGLRSHFSSSGGTAIMGTLGVYLKRFRISYLYQAETGSGLSGLNTHEIGIDFKADWKKRSRDRSSYEF